MHVRTAAYDLFDGLAWHEVPISFAGFLVEKEPASNWMHVLQRASNAVFAEVEAHRFKITASNGQWIPSPPQLTRFRIGRVNQADFFAWGQDRIFRMAQRKVPSGIIVETECHTVDPQRLDGVSFPSASSGDAARYAALPPNLSPEVAALAREWTGGLPNGWPQIAALVGHLRTGYSVDATARMPPDTADPLGHFLLRFRRGPDYQFATAVAIMARRPRLPNAVGERLLRRSRPLRLLDSAYAGCAGRFALLAGSDAARRRLARARTYAGLRATRALGVPLGTC